VCACPISSSAAKPADKATANLLRRSSIFSAPDLTTRGQLFSKVS